MSTGKPKIALILERSEDYSVQVGLVKDCHGSIKENTENCDTVGTWGRLGEGILFVELTTSVEALQDTFIKLIAERAKSKEMAIYPAYTVDRTTHTTRPRRLAHEPVREEPSIEFNNLRARLSR